MKVAIGEGCEKKTWQDTFEKQIACGLCGHTAELAFVAYEGLDKDGEIKVKPKHNDEKWFGNVLNVVDMLWWLFQS